MSESFFEPLETRLLLSAYHLTFDDEFNTLDLADKSGTDTGWMVRDYWYNAYYAANGDQQYFSDPAVDGYNPFSVDDGILSITAEPTPSGVDADDKPYVSGMLTTTKGSPWTPQSAGFAQQYGYFEIRCKIPEGQRVVSAFWMLPENGSWPPEYDVFETLGRDSDNILQTSHWVDDGHQMDYKFYTGVIDAADGFHTYGFEWTPEKIKWYVDGELAQVQDNRVDQPMYMLLNLGVGGIQSGADEPIWPLNYEIDYVRVYSADASDPEVTPQTGYSLSEYLPIDVGQNNVDFSSLSVSSYGSGQDLSGGLTVQDDGTTGVLTGNSWKKVAFRYDVTANTVLEFDYSSTDQGEIQGIGLDENNVYNDTTRLFQLYGADVWTGAHQDYNNYDGSGTAHYIIPIGEFYTGQMNYMAFVNDGDSNTGVESFSNIALHEVTEVPVDFSDKTFTSYDVAQDLSGGVTVADGGATAVLTGNSWKKINYNYTVTENTILEFDFSSTDEGEVHAIGLDDDAMRHNAKRMFQVYGTQDWNGDPDGAYQNYNNYSGSGTTHYTIPIGEFYTGEMSYLVFANDGDSNTGISRFSNVTLYELDGAIDFSDTTFSSYSTQDYTGGATVEDNGATVVMSGNSWKKITCNYAVTANTILEFDFSSTDEGEIHGIGLEENNTYSDATRIFQIHGTDVWTGAHQVYNNYAGGTQHYTISIGEFYTGLMNYLAFVNDGDSNAGVGSFSNVRIYEADSTTVGVTADAYVRGGTYANTNFADSNLVLKNNGTDDIYTREIYLKFDLSSVSTFSSGVLRLYLNSSTYTGTTGVSVYAGASSSWSESVITYNNRPGTTGTALDTTTVDIANDGGSWIEWDVSSYLLSQQALGCDVVTLVLKADSYTSGIMQFDSDESGSNGPELVLS